MSESRKGTYLKECQKCHVDMNGDMLDAQGVCPRCKAEAVQEQQKKQKDNRDTVAKNASDMDSEADYSEFIGCDRSGRRNAIPDLQGDSAALKMEKLASTMDDIALAEETQVTDDSEKKPGMTPKIQDRSPTL
ncbi:cAMP-dependent protein kinase inhibitor gamma [Anolis carolinensis]|uniref:cAMP-dependent protein kinase inhibitor gamma n=1 Tax=Anolis carolinensis TaxID=28377 RepID=UPI000203967C